jgi:DNA-binding phage protein
MERVIKQASWDSMQEGRADILQAAIRSYVEQFGHNAVIERAGIRSRTSAYRSLKPETTPSFRTLVQLGHAVIELAKDRVPTYL